MWTRFYLHDNPDPGAGFLYSMRYSVEMLNLKRDKIIEVLERDGLKMIFDGNEFYVKPDDTITLCVAIWLNFNTCIRDFPLYPLNKGTY